MDMTQQSATHLDSSGSILNSTRLRHLPPTQPSLCFPSQVHRRLLFSLHPSLRSEEASLTLSRQASVEAVIHPPSFLPHLCTCLNALSPSLCSLLPLSFTCLFSLRTNASHNSYCRQLVEIKAVCVRVSGRACA